MKAFVAVAVICLAAFAASKSISSNGRIINGEDAKKGEFPWQVAIDITTSNGNTFCGGSLISSKWVLTAAHCLNGATEVVLTMGGIKLHQQEDGEIEMKSKSFVIHPQFDVDSLENDVALIELPENVKETTNIQAIKLPLRGSYFGGYVNADVSGWGETNDGGDYSSTLKHAKLHSITNEECYKYYGIGIIKRSTLCCKGNEAQSTCHGDSGSALVSVDKEGVTRQVGVTSFVSSLGCESEYPSGYVRTESVLEWISNETGMEI